jgi:hypothetical protein
MVLNGVAMKGAKGGKSQSRFRTLAPKLALDVVGPLVVYYSLRSFGWSTVGSLILSGLLPGFGVILGVVLKRRLDAIGAMVLLGIGVGAGVGLVSGNPHLVLIEHTIPTAVFGIFCLSTLASSRPLIFRFALEMLGPDTDKGLSFADKWRYIEFRRAFQLTTIVWGMAFLGEAVLQLVMVEVASADVARATGSLLPIIFGVVVVSWNILYARRGQRMGARAEAVARERGDVPPPMPA